MDRTSSSTIIFVYYNTVHISELLDETPELINARNENGMTALIVAAALGSTALTTLLLNRRANVNAADQSGFTALTWASTGLSSNTEIITQLLDRGAAIDARDNEGCTALIRTVISGDPEIAIMLARRGANPETRNNEGLNALDHCENDTQRQEIEYAYAQRNNSAATP